MFTPTLRHLFHPDNLEEYLDSIRSGSDHLAATLGRVSGPSTGTSPGQAAAPVAEIDLDEPVEDLDVALEELSRVYLDDAIWFHEPSYAAHLNCPVVIPALLAELFVSAVNSSLDTFDQSVGGTHIERRLVEWTAARIGFPTGTGRVGPGRHLHQRRDPVQPAGPAAGARHRRRHARGPLRPAARARLRRRPLQRREVRQAARAGARRRHPGAVRPLAPDARPGTRGRGAAVPRRRPRADGRGRHGRHHRLRCDRPDPADRRGVRPVRGVAARRRGVRRRAARLASPAAPARRHRARRLGDRRLPQDLVPAGLRECGDRPRRPRRCGTSPTTPTT